MPKKGHVRWRWGGATGDAGDKVAHEPQGRDGTGNGPRAGGWICTGLVAQRWPPCAVIGTPVSSQQIHVSHHRVVSLQYIPFLIVNHTSAKLEKSQSRHMSCADVNGTNFRARRVRSPTNRRAPPGAPAAGKEASWAGTPISRCSLHLGSSPSPTGVRGAGAGGTGA